MGWLHLVHRAGGGARKGVSSQAIVRTFHKHKGWMGTHKSFS